MTVWSNFNRVWLYLLQLSNEFNYSDEVLFNTQRFAKHIDSTSVRNWKDKQWWDIARLPCAPFDKQNLLQRCQTWAKEEALAQLICLAQGLLH